MKFLSLEIRFLEILSGVLWTSLWASWICSGYLTLGASYPVRSGLLIGAAAGLSLGGFLLSRFQPGVDVRWLRFTGFLSYAITALSSSLLLTIWTRLSLLCIRLLPDSPWAEAISSGASTFLLFLIPEVIGIAILFGISLRQKNSLVDCTPARQWNWQASRSGSPFFLLGCGLFLLFGFTDLTRTIGWERLNSICAAIALVAMLVSSKWGEKSGQSPSEEKQSSSLSVQGIVGLLCVASLWAATERLLVQYLPATVEFSVGFVGLVFLGGAAQLGLDQWRQSRSHWLRSMVEISPWIFLLMLTLTTSTFGWSLRTAAWINETFSSSWLISLVRLGLIGPVAFPLGALLIRCSQPRKEESSSRTQVGPAREWGFLFWTVGYAVAMLLLPSLGPVSVLVLGVAGLLLIEVSSLLRGLSSLRAVRVELGLILGAFALAIATYGSYQPAYATQYLFSSRMTDPRSIFRGTEMVSFCSDTHLVAERSGTTGHLTLWKSHGEQLQLRVNGVPKGTTTLDPEIHPDYSAELLLGVLPLVLHERADQILLLGVGGGAPLVATLATPAQRIDCIESDQEALRILRENLTVGERINWQDDRLTLRRTNPQGWLPGASRRYDVVLSNPDPIPFFGASAAFTREYYQQIYRSMNPGGIFCQRFQCADFGSRPWLQTVATMRAVFRDVMTIEAAEGDFLLLGTNDPTGVIRPGMLERIQAPQVSRVLSNLGWDSLLPLTLPMIHGEGLEKLIASQSSINTVRNGSFAFDWPREISRWGDKHTELHSQLAGATRKLLDLMPREAESRVVLRRLGEIQAQNDLIVNYPDQYWAYRKNLKEEVSKNPKTLIKQIDFEVNRGRLDAEDKRRMSYFSMLGLAAKTLALEDMERLEKFIEPFDPLLSPFVPQEIAELSLRANHPDPHRELRHRLHTIYYSGPADRSVLYVADALNLLVKHPEAITDPKARWHQQDSLLQVMKMRWDFRGRGKPGVPRIMYRDASLSLSAIEQTLATMRDSSAAAGIAPHEFRLRQHVLQRTLVQPLQVFRQSLSPYLTPAELAHGGAASREKPVDSEQESRQERPLGVQSN